jgi:hypothetical protein
MAALLTLALVLCGCLFVRETEHRVKLNDDGSGEAQLRLVDIRSDGATDSAVTADLNDMLASFESDLEDEFARRGRTLQAKRLLVQGDTLHAELQYAFRRLSAIEGLMVTPDELAIIVGPEREIVRTNGTVRPWQQNSLKISWPRDAERMLYRIRERTVPPSVMLGLHYRRRTEN